MQSTPFQIPLRNITPAPVSLIKIRLRAQSRACLSSCSFDPRRIIFIFFLKAWYEAVQAINCCETVIKSPPEESRKICPGQGADKGDSNHRGSVE